MMKIISFGFRYGVPEADHVFDVRGLFNVPKLWAPLSEKVIRRVTSSHTWEPIINAIKTKYCECCYIEKDCTIAIGCSFGKHRSPLVAEFVADWLRGSGIEVKVIHSNKGRG